MGRADIGDTSLAAPPGREPAFAMLRERGGAVAARRAHNPKVVSSNLTRATKLRRQIAPMIGAVLTVVLAACGSTTIAPNNGPYASPPKSPPDRVLSRVCNAQTSADKTADTQFMAILMIRQGTDLGRVGDDLTGAVPGGNFPVDANLALRDATDLKTLVDSSRLCEPLKSRLSKAVQDLIDSDQALVNSGGGSGAASALGDAQAKYQALMNLVNNPPSA